MILGLELLTLDNRQIGLLQVVYALVENLWHISTTKLSVKPSFIYKITFLALSLNRILHILFTFSLFN